MGAIATAIFGMRNIGKVNNGETGRIGAVGAQTTNLVNAASHSKFAPINKGANVILNGVDDAGRLVGITNAAGKITNFASKAVNPMLCVASGIRILNDDDKYAAIIEEAGAMGTMFAAEKLYKNMILNPVAGKELATNSKIIKSVATKVDDLTKGLTGKKKLVATILTEVGLVCVSILGFDTGKKIGKKFSNREVQQANIQQPIIYAQDSLNSKVNGVYYNS